jgi:ubiquinone/menaquinone biosynthesis C-methylase UbiE
MAQPPKSSVLDYDRVKSNEYFAGARQPFVDALRTDARSSILEIGCSYGGTGALALGSGKCARYIGVDISEKALVQAKKVLTETHLGNVEAMALPWSEESFDALILSEVLEHLVDPWATLERLARLVRPGGQLLVGSPNIANLSVVRSLLRGRFDYREQGVMDRTHLRWFTPATYRELVSGAGFIVEECLPANTGALSRTRVRLFDLATGGRFNHLWWNQIVIYAVKKT